MDYLTLIVPPIQPLNLDIEAISGICGSISIACWVVVFTPQILQNFRRSSTDGLSVRFVSVWLTGDICNIMGAIYQKVHTTMLIVAIYYAIADTTLLSQCFYYRGFTWSDKIIRSNPESTATPSENTPLLTEGHPHHPAPHNTWTNLSPAVPIVADESLLPPAPPKSAFQLFLYHLFAVFIVIAAGFFGWFVSARTGTPHSVDPDVPTTVPEMSRVGQIFGYLCAFFYISSRLPQLKLNYDLKSTEGLSMMFSLFACLGNITYVLSILVYEPSCEVPGKCYEGEVAEAYKQYIRVNLSWFLGSSLTLLLDFIVFYQFFYFNGYLDGLLERKVRRSGVIRQ